MLISGTRRRHRLAAASTALGVLLVGAAGTPAYAESTREQQWFLDAMQAEDMWQTSTGEGVTVAVIDSGVDPDNPDLEGRVLPGEDFAPDEPGDEHTDYNGHGTGMAGLIAGTGAWGGGKGAFGLAPGAKILPIRVPPGESAANKAAQVERFNEITPKAIRYAADEGAQIINISLGVTAGSPQLTEAVRYALAKGSLIFASVGNSGDEGNLPEYPGATPGVVGVGAVGKDLRRTDESQHGPQVDIAAPGEEMVHTCGNETGLCTSHGTSDATALASASAALIWSEHPDWTNNQVLRVMLNTIGAPTDGAERNDSIGYGIVRPRIALEAPGNPGPADEYPLPDLSAAEPPASPEATSPGDPQDDTPADQQSPAATATPSDDGNTPLWLALGAGAAVLAAAALTLVVRSRRQPATPVPPPPAPGQFGYPTTAYPPPPNAQSAPSDRYPPST
ncbi:type VII secretion-associated serine protease mycosin [Streptomyces sp. NPDC059477]|uniref:type VII secretion-associated serine protease mycosin n=1 Tax=Streptomyces sp. NPDC059477 TaxID=3346847 RepID=UPI0036A631D3